MHSTVFRIAFLAWFLALQWYPGANVPRTGQGGHKPRTNQWSLVPWPVVLVGAYVFNGSPPEGPVGGLPLKRHMVFFGQVNLKDAQL